MDDSNAMIQVIQEEIQEAKAERARKLDKAHTRGDSIAKMIFGTFQPVTDWLNEIKLNTMIEYNPENSSVTIRINSIDGFVAYKFYINNEEACHYFECTMDDRLGMSAGLNAFSRKIDYSKSPIDYTGAIFDGIKKIAVYAAKVGSI